MRRAIYIALRIVGALDHALRERLTAAGWLALGAAGAAFAAGLDTTQNASYQAATLLGALLLLAWGASLLFRVRVAVRRELPRYATDCEPCSYVVAVENRGARALAGATLRERLAGLMPFVALFNQ